MLHTGQWISVLRLADLYNFARIRQKAIEVLELLVWDRPALMAALATRYDVDDWLYPALATLVRREEPFEMEDYLLLGPDAILALARVREKYVKCCEGCPPPNCKSLHISRAPSYSDQSVCSLRKYASAGSAPSKTCGRPCSSAHAPGASAVGFHPALKGSFPLPLSTSAYYKGRGRGRSVIYERKLVFNHAFTDSPHLYYTERPQFMEYSSGFTQIDVARKAAGNDDKHGSDTR